MTLGNDAQEPQALPMAPGQARGAHSAQGHAQRMAQGLFCEAAGAPCVPALSGLLPSQPQATLGHRGTLRNNLYRKFREVKELA